MSDSLYEIFRSKNYALAYTTVIHSALEVEAQNAYLQGLGYPVNHNNPSTYKYYLNLTGVYHQYDMDLIAKLNGDGHPYMRIKIAGDNQPIDVDFTKDLLTGAGGDLNLAAEYVYGSQYYNELLNRYPGCESLILGILNPIDMDTALSAENGDILYCGGYYRKRLPNILKETYGFVKRDDVTVDAEFLVQDWEQDIIYSLQDYVKFYLKRWEVPDFAANHSYYPALIRTGLIGGMVPTIEKLRLKNVKTYAAHDFHVRMYINSYGFLGENIDALTRDQAMYLYLNMDWLTTNKGKNKVIDALIDNLLTPANIPLVAYDLVSNTYAIQTRDSNYAAPTFMKNYLNLKPENTDKGTSTQQLLEKTVSAARDNSLNMADQVAEVNSNIQYSGFNKIETKVMESSYQTDESNSLFNKEQFQLNNWIYAVSQDKYHGSIFITHPTSNGRIQLTPKSALILYIYAYTKGYLGYELDTVPPLVVRNIPKEKIAIPNTMSAYPTDDDLWSGVTSPHVTQAKVNLMKGFPTPVGVYRSATEFFTLTESYYEVLETRMSYAMAESDLHANAELEIIASKFYQPYVLVNNLLPERYTPWFSDMGLEFGNLDTSAWKGIADELISVGVGGSEADKNATERMHSALMTIFRFFISYTMQLTSSFSSSLARLYGFKTIRISNAQTNIDGVSNVEVGNLGVVDAFLNSAMTWKAVLGDTILQSTTSNESRWSKWVLMDMGLDYPKSEVAKKSVNMIGITVNHPITIDNTQTTVINPVTDTLLLPLQPTRHTAPGVNLGMTLTPDVFEFLDTLGLQQITQNDFTLTLKVEL